MKRAWSFITALMLLATSVRVGLAEPAAGEQIPLEYKVKAAYLFNFARFVMWPTAQAGSPIVIGLVGDDPFFATVENALKGALVEGRPVKVKKIERPEDIKSANILYIAPSADEQVPYYLSLVRRQPILTVGETRRFIAQGGMVRLYTAGEKVVFAVNSSAAERAGLTMSSQMLQFARMVEP